MVRRIDVLQIVAGAHRGTGFLIAADRVLTALHVIGRVEAGRLVAHGEITMTAAVERGDALELVRYEVDEHDVVDFDDAFDWACLAVAGLAGVAIHPVAEARDLRDEWRSYGFPDSAEAPIGKATLGRVVSLGAALELGGAVRRVLQLFSLEAGAGLGGKVRGFSGGPVVVGGHAVGMITSAPLRGGVRAEDGTLYAVALPYRGPHDGSWPARSAAMCFSRSTPTARVRSRSILVKASPRGSRPMAAARSRPRRRAQSSWWRLDAVHALHDQLVG